MFSGGVGQFVVFIATKTSHIGNMYRHISKQSDWRKFLWQNRKKTNIKEETLYDLKVNKSRDKLALYKPIVFDNLQKH